MGLADRVSAAVTEKRTIGGVPWVPFVPFGSGGPAHPSQYHRGQDSAISLTPAYGAVRLLADGVASLPLRVYRQVPDGTKQRWTGPSIFDQPGPRGTLYDWLFEMMTSLLLQGNALGYITSRDGFGFPTTIVWLPYERCHIQDEETPDFANPVKPHYFYCGREMAEENLLHIKAFSVPGRTAGISPLRAFQILWETGHDLQNYGSMWFRNGGFPPGTFRNSEIEITREQSREIRENLMETLRARQPLVYGRDWEYQPVSVPPSEAQFIEAARLSATQIAAIYGVPPERIGGTRGDSLTYNCVDEDTEILTLRGWLRYDQVTTDDTCLGLNLETGLAEWQPVSGVHVFEDGPYPVVRMENLTHSSVSTGNHRWPVMISGRPGQKARWRWTTTDEMPTDARILAAAPVAAPAEPKWSDDIVELVAWLWTEGWAGAHGSVTITQSRTVNPANVARIRNALTSLIGPSGELHARSVPSWREDEDDRGIVKFRLNAKAGRMLLEHAPGKIVSTAWLAELTRAQLELFIRISVDADGTRMLNRDGSRRSALAQRDRARADAFQVACALAGKPGVVRLTKAGMWQMCVGTVPWRKPKGHARYLTQEQARMVWCVTTPSHSWFARREGTTYFTGNTQEQGTNDLITWSLRPWLVRAETAFFKIMPAQRYCRFFANAMVRADTLTRFQAYQIARQIGLQTIAEQRDDDDLPPLTSAVAEEELPLDVLVAMARGLAAVPKSFSELIDEAKPPASPPSQQPPPGPLNGPNADAGANPPLNVVPPGSSPPAQANSWGPRYSAEDIAVAVYGLAGRRKEYVDLVCLAARDGGYAVTGTRSAAFGKEQAEWIASAVRDRPRPVEHLALNGNGNGNHG